MGGGGGGGGEASSCITLPLWSSVVTLLIFFPISFRF